MNITVSSNDVIDGMRDKISELVYENSVLRAQVKTVQRQYEELEAKLKEASE